MKDSPLSLLCINTYNRSYAHTYYTHAHSHTRAYRDTQNPAFLNPPTPLAALPGHFVGPASVHISGVQTHHLHDFL